MSDSAMNGILIILCIFVFLQVLGDVNLIFKKKKFLKYIEKQFQCTLKEQAVLFVSKAPSFTSFVNCHFLGEKKAAEYVAVYSDENMSYCTLLHFFYHEQEQVISERLEIVEFEEKDWNTVLAPYNVTFSDEGKKWIRGVIQKMMAKFRIKKSS